MWEILRKRRGFRRLYSGDVISMLGDWFTYVAVSVLALEQGQGLWAVVLVLVAHTLPRALFAPLAGWFADRVDRRTMLVWASVCRGVLVLGMAAAAVAGSLLWVQGLLLARMGAGAWVDAPARAMLPRLVAPEEIAAANGLSGATWSVVFALGVALGGVVTAVTSPLVALLVDAATFFVAAVLYWGIGEVRVAVQQRVRMGWRRPEGGVLEAALGKVVVAAANGGAWVWLHAVVQERFVAAMAMTLGMLHLMRAIGTGVGPLLWHRFERLRGTKLGMNLSMVVGLAGVGWFVAVEDGWWLAAASLVWGIGVGSNWVGATTRLQRLAPDAHLGRWTAVDLTAQTLAQCLGGVGVAWAAHEWGLEAAQVVPVLVGMVLWLGMVLLLRRNQRCSSGVTSFLG